MAIDFTKTFTQIGRVGHAAYVIAGGQAGLPAAFTSLFAQFTGQHNIIGPIEGQAESLWRANGAGSLLGTLGPVALAALLAQVAADVPSQGQSLQPALVELIRQMKIGAQTVKACTIAITPTALPSMVGTGIVVTSTNRGDGLIQQNAIAETARLVCTRDSYEQTATANQEPFQFAGASVGLARIWDYDWPLGSGAIKGVPTVTPALDGQAGANVMTNGDFETWSTDPAPVLQKWTTAQTWGTELQRSAVPFTGSFALQLNAAAATAIYQEFGNAATGTPILPAALNSIAVNLWTRKGTGTITTGVLTVELVDGTGTVINDAQGVANSFTIALTGLSTSYVAKNGVFRLPTIPPAVIRLRLRLSTALAGGTVLIDDIAAAPLIETYAGGPGVRIFAGDVPFAVGDGWNLAVTNDRGGASYGATMQTLFNRLFRTAGLNLILPYDPAPTQADTLITA